MTHSGLCECVCMIQVFTDLLKQLRHRVISECPFTPENSLKVFIEWAVRNQENISLALLCLNEIKLQDPCEVEPISVCFSSQEIQLNDGQKK